MKNRLFQYAWYLICNNQIDLYLRQSQEQNVCVRHCVLRHLSPLNSSDNPPVSTFHLCQVCCHEKKFCSIINAQVFCDDWCSFCSNGKRRKCRNVSYHRADCKSSATETQLWRILVSLFQVIIRRAGEKVKGLISVKILPQKHPKDTLCMVQLIYILYVCMYVYFYWLRNYLQESTSCTRKRGQ